jgi:hypothetical protein
VVFKVAGWQTTISPRKVASARPELWLNLGRYEVIVRQPAGNHKEQYMQGVRPMPGTAKRRSLRGEELLTSAGEKEIGEGKKRSDTPW